MACPPKKPDVDAHHAQNGHFAPRNGATDITILDTKKECGIDQQEPHSKTTFMPFQVRRTPMYTIVTAKWYARTASSGEAQARDASSCSAS